MGLQSAMTTALTGLQAAETTIDVVGNNVANSNTAGFKESNVLFATQFLQTQSIGSAPSTSSGGTNPRQIGLGVSVAEIAPNFTQGTIQVSANPLDLAIQGDGFFILQGPNGGSQQFYTRNGQFKTNALNQLVSTSGNRVLGYGVNDQFVIDTNTVFFFNDTATTEIYTLSLHDALPISVSPRSSINGCDAARRARATSSTVRRSEEHTSELQSQSNLVCRLLLEKKK